MTPRGLAQASDPGAEPPLPSAHVPASALVYETLRARIISLQLPPGTRLSRSELAAAFGVSQSPVREALQQLETVGLVATFRQSRTEVTLIDPAQLRQENFLRAGIECEVAHALASTADPGAVLLKARGVLKMQAALADDMRQIELFRRLDSDFHRELFAAAGQAPLHGLVADRSSQMARVRALDLPRESKMRSVVEGHAAVLEAIEAGDRHAAADAMRRHLSGSIERLPEIIAQHRDYFGPV
ncbi:transcriptional regulator, GntR family [Albimonas donghaensis]|uniref:Transcriptional regulator, GntR family n=1 Tax=Albimonas donghaensis TaxID=356660 RepID=A0A1H3ACW3_9RHOB|nr:GntR family transcriptional regulator [Albimonas donghaensis]SDX27138.1 transcriptional regulator, GntR family [Albimonas donghaensis]